MPKVAKGRRKRAYRPKTRTGCLTCKARRVKCDETKPHCLRCTTTRRACDGYPLVDCVEPSGFYIAPLALSIDPSADTHPCALSRRSFSFFVQRTSPQLAGLFGSTFWEKLVLQAAHHEPAIRHAITAIGSLHETKTRGRDSELKFALQQYNLAIRSLLAPPSPGPQRALDVSLISCILFICFENMQGNHTMAEFHIQSGSKLLKGIVYDHQNDALQHQTPAWKRQIRTYVPLESLIGIFAVLDKEAAMIVRDYHSPTYDSYFIGAMKDDINFVFPTIEEARNMFEYSLYSFTGSDPAASSSDTGTSTELGLLQDRVGHFSVLIDKFLIALRTFLNTRGPSLTPREKASLAVLQLHVLNSYVSFYYEYLPEASRPHSSVLSPKMREMVSLCEQIIPYVSDGTEAEEQRTSFCLDFGYVIPLYTVASQCPDIATRWRAIALLRSRPRQEGLWNSLVVAKAAERIMEIEESIGKELMPWAAVAPLPTSTNPRTVLQLDSRGVRLQYVQPGKDDTVPVGVVEEVVIW